VQGQVQIRDGPSYSDWDCPEIGRLTSRLKSTITVTFVAGRSYGGICHDQHIRGKDRDAD